MKAHNSSTRLGFIKGVALAAILVGVTPALYADPLVNGDFESGLSGWSESGGSGLFSAPDSLAVFYETISPLESGHFGLVSNNGVESSSISQTFDITNNYIVFSYRFLTDEYNSGADFNDFASITLTINGTPTTLLSVSRDDLQLGGEGSLSDGASYLDNTQHGFDIGQDSWRTYSADVSAFVGQTGTLSFSITNVNDSTADIGVSHLAVDNVHLSAVPEPATYAILTVAGLLMLVRRWRLRA